MELRGGSIKKRKLTLEEIGRCHPRNRKTGAGTRKEPRQNTGAGAGAGTGTGKGACLPVSIYQRVMSRTQRKKDRQKRNTGRKESAYSMVGCAEGADHCLLDHISLSDEKKKALRKQYLRPRRPKEWQKKPDMWLDNYNIQNVMKQYEETYSWLHFLGVFPIDFSAPDPYRKNGEVQCLNQELCNLDLQKEYKRGIRGIAMVFNLDPHYKGGSHWVALYINLTSIERPVVGYFDSYGYKAPTMISRFMRSLQLQVKECVLGYNARRFQYGGSECGMFSIYFLICMIHGISFDEFCKDALHDRSMLELRSALFGL